MIDMRSTNLNMNYGSWNIQVAVTGIVSENSKAVEFSRYHAEDMGAVGYKNYCKKCGKDIGWNDITKGYEVAGKIVPFNENELKELQTSSGIQVLGTTKENPELWQIKKCYLLDMGKDKKTEKLNTINYAIVKNKLKRMGVSLVVKAKTSNRGVKSGGDVSLIRYDERYNRLVLITLYYTEEITPIEKMAEPPLPEEVLTRVADKTFAGLTEISIATISEEQSKKVLEQVTAKLGNPLEEGKEQVLKPKVSEEEQLLMKML